MSIPIWPAELPQRMNRNDFGFELASGGKEGRSDSGPPRSRLRYSRAAKPISGSFDMTAAQLGRFWRFWEEEIAQGVLPFWLRDQLVDGLKLITPDGLPLVTPAGQPIVMSSWWLAKFQAGTAPRLSAPGGTLRRLAVSLWEMP